MHGIHNVDIRPAGAPHIHHCHGQILLMHLHMYLILNYTFDVLQRAGKYHRRVCLQNRKVHQMIGFQQKSREFQMIDIGLVIPDRHIDQILIPFDIDHFHAFFFTDVLDSADFEAFQGIASDGCGLCHDDPLRLCLFDFTDTCPYCVRAGADRCLRGLCMTDIRFDDYRLTFFDHVGYAAHQVKYPCHVLLNIQAFRQCN